MRPVLHTTAAGADQCAATQELDPDVAVARAVAADTADADLAGAGGLDPRLLSAQNSEIALLRLTGRMIPSLRHSSGRTRRLLHIWPVSLVLLCLSSRRRTRKLHVRSLGEPVTSLQRPLQPLYLRPKRCLVE